MINLPRKTQFPLGSSPPANDASVFGSTAAGSTAYSDDIVEQQCGIGGTTPTAQWLAGFLSALVGNGSPISTDHATLFQMLATQIAYILQKMGAYYDANTTYYVGDVATFGSPPVSYQSLTNSNTGNTPNTSPANWGPFISAQTAINPALPKAWAVFTGNGTVNVNCTIQGAMNVTSVVKRGSGNYEVNCTNSVGSTNYGVTASSMLNNGQSQASDAGSIFTMGLNGGPAAVKTGTQFKFYMLNGSGTPRDTLICFVAVFGP